MPGMTPELLKTLTGILTEVAALYQSIDVPLKANVANYQAAVMQAGDLALVHSHVRPDDDFVRDNTGDGLTKAYLTRAMQRFSAPIRDLRLAGVADLRTFAEYYNTGEGGPYQCLLPAAFTALYQSLTGIALRPEDTLPPVGSRLGHATVSGGGAPGTGVDTALYAGCPAPVAVVLAGEFTDSRAAGSNRLTVTGQARDRAGAVQEDRTFTAKVNSMGTFALTAAVEGDLLVSACEITLPTNMTTGGIGLFTSALAA